MNVLFTESQLQWDLIKWRHQDGGNQDNEYKWVALCLFYSDSLVMSHYSSHQVTNIQPK